MRTPQALLLIAFVALPACKKKEADNAPANTPPATKITAEATPTTPKKPTAPTYTPAAADKLIAELGSCSSRFSCDAYKTLTAFGDKAAAKLAAYTIDGSQKLDSRKITVAAIEEIFKEKSGSDTESATKLFEAAKKEQDFMLRKNMFAGAALLGGESMMEPMLSYYTSPAADKARHKTEIQMATRGFPKAKLFAWAIAGLAKKPKDEIIYVNIVKNTATKAELPKVIELIKAVKDRMAKHRLANAAIALGDTSQFPILIAGLKAKNVYDRSDAANMLADVLDKLPEDNKAEVLKLAEAGKKKDRGGLTSRGYNKIIKKLSK